MTEKTPLDIVLENFSLSDVAREVLGEAPIAEMDNTSAIAALKQELVYYTHQAEHGAEKSRHVFADKANKIKAEIEKLQMRESNINKKSKLTESKRPAKIEVVDFTSYFKKL